MNRLFAAPWILAAALALIVGGVWSTLTLQQRPDALRRLDRKRETARQLRELKTRRDRAREAMALWNALPRTAPASLTELLGGARWSEAGPEIRDGGEETLADGWSLRAADVTFQDLELSRLPAVFAAVETQRPPWRITEGRIVATRVDGAYGQVTLHLETLIYSMTAPPPGPLR